MARSKLVDDENKCSSRRPSTDAASSDVSTEASEEFVASTKSKRLSNALCLEKRALACPLALHLAQPQIYGSSSALVRSGLVPRCAPAPLLLPKQRLTWSTRTGDSDGESDASSSASEQDLTSRGVIKKKSVTFADTAETILLPTPKTSAAGVPPPTFPRSPLNEDTLQHLELEAVVEAVIDHVQDQLMSHDDCVIDAAVTEGPRGWTVTAYVKPRQLKLQEEGLKEIAQQAVLDAAENSDIVHVLGHRTQPFASTPLGFRCVLATMPDPDRACWASYSRGFCRSPASCRFQHPKDQAEIQMILKPALSG